MFNLTTPHKTCTRCGETKPATTEHFGIRKRAKDGLHIWCRLCEDAYQKEYRKANKERLAAKERERVAANKDEVAAYKRRWAEENAERLSARKREKYEANKSEILAKQAQYRADNPERVKASRRAEYERNKEKYIKRSKQWAKANPDRARELYRKSERSRPPEQKRAKYQKRRSFKAGKPDTFTAEQWQYCLDYFNGCCAVCERPMSGLFHRPHADHWIALSDPDSPGTIATNMVCLCGGRDGCNESKGHKRPDLWLEEKFGKRKAKQVTKRIQAYFDSLRE